MHACVTDGQTDIRTHGRTEGTGAAGQGKVEGGSMGNATS